MIARSACFLLAIMFAGTAVSAQDAPASAPPSPVPSGFSGRAHITVTFPFQSSNMSASARVTVAQSDQLTRVELVSVDQSILPVQIPRFTFVVNRRTNTVTAWNDTARVYYTQAFLPQQFGGPARLSPPPGTSARPSRPERSALASVDLLTFNLRLTGHTTTAGIASTGLAFDMKVRRHGQTALSHITGTVQIADDFAFFPVAIQAQIHGNGLGTPATFLYTVDSFDRDAPLPEAFVIPDGYREATSLIGVFTGVARRNRVPLAAPSVSPSASP
jgi:hypothetical protein